MPVNKRFDNTRCLTWTAVFCAAVSCLAAQINLDLEASLGFNQPKPDTTAASSATWEFPNDDELVRVRFREVDTLFANPGQGWMSQQRSPRGEPRFPCSVVYVRFNWADAEPEPGQFNWRLIDDVIAAWKPRGAAVAMRVMTCNALSAAQPQPNDCGAVMAFVPGSALCRAALNGATSSHNGGMMLALVDELQTLCD